MIKLYIVNMKNYLKLALEIPDPKDYMKVVTSHIGNY